MMYSSIWLTDVLEDYPGRSFRWPDPFKSESVPVQFLSIPVESGRFRSDSANSLAPDSGRKFKGNFRSLPDRFRSEVCRNWTELVAGTLNGIRWQGNRRNRNRPGRNRPSTNDLGTWMTNGAFLYCHVELWVWLSVLFLFKKLLFREYKNDHLLNDVLNCFF